MCYGNGIGGCDSPYDTPWQDFNQAQGHFDQARQDRAEAQWYFEHGDLYNTARELGEARQQEAEGRREQAEGFSKLFGFGFPGPFGFPGFPGCGFPGFPCY
jgi:hypothetical protein